MDYHRDRFIDHSLLCYDEKNRLIAVLPAIEQVCDDAKLLSSHAGLTYGGFILSQSAKSKDVLSLFEAVKDYMSKNGFCRLVYKAIPFIYHKQPSEEEEYALWLNEARLDICNLSTVIDLRSLSTIQLDCNRTRGRRKALYEGYSISETDSLDELWPIVEQSLQEKYDVAPVHTLDEISLLRNYYPQNIRVWVALHEGKVAGGIVVYETTQVAHSQYSHATNDAKHHGVMDFLYLHLLNYYKRVRPDIRYFDFGISNEEHGRLLNSNLISYKEDFGGRGVTYKIWSLDV